jgi:hypothetical protein
MRGYTPQLAEQLSLGPQKNPKIQPKKELV